MTPKVRKTVENSISQLENIIGYLDGFEKIFIERSLSDLYNALNVDTLLNDSKTTQKPTPPKNRITKDGDPNIHEKEKKDNGNDKT